MELEDLLGKGLRLPTNDDSMDVEMGPKNDSTTMTHQEIIIG